MPQKIDNNKLWKLTKIALNVAMGMVYLIIGFFIIKKQWFISSLDITVSYALGGVLILYGVFRIYRIYSESKK